MPTIMFVCTANRFRSPIAAACFQRELQERKLGLDWTVCSAGTWTTDGLPPVPGALASAHQIGLEIGGHTSQVVRPALISAADLILVMEQGQREALQSEFPRSAHKVRLFSQAAAGQTYDIPDAGPATTPVEVAKEIRDLIRAGFDRIYALVEQQ